MGSFLKSPSFSEPAVWVLPLALTTSETLAVEIFPAEGALVGLPAAVMAQKRVEN